MKTIKVVLSPAASRVLRNREFRQQFKGLLRSLETGQTKYQVLPGGLTFVRQGALRVIGISDKTTLTIQAIVHKDELQRTVRRLPPESIQDYEFRGVSDGVGRYHKNPPRKRKKTFIDKRFRKQINVLFGKKAGDLLIAYILSQGVQGWIEILKLLAAGIKWKVASLGYFLIN